MSPFLKYTTTIIDEVFFLIETGRMQEAVDLEKIFQKEPPKVEENQKVQLMNALRVFTIPRQNDAVVYAHLQKDVLRLLQSPVSLKKSLDEIIFSYPESSQALIRFDLFSHYAQNSELLGGISIRKWMEKYLQFTKASGKTTTYEKTTFIEKKAPEHKLSEQEKKLLFSVLDLFDSLRPNISLAEILEQERQGAPQQNNVTPKEYLPPSEGRITSSEESMLNIKQFSLKKAIEKYPRIMNQRVTDADILFRGSDGAVVPSVKNWMTAYHQEVGSGTHEPFERSEFLFHNKSALLLSQNERNTLSEILRSLDEESDLPINIDTQTIDLGAIGERFTTIDVESPRESGVPQEEMQTTPVQGDPVINRNIPPAERSTANLYNRESIDNRRDVWHQTNVVLPTPSIQTIPASSPSFTRGLSFTAHTQEEIGKPPLSEDGHLPLGRGREQGRSTLHRPSVAVPRKDADILEALPASPSPRRTGEERRGWNDTSSPSPRGDLGMASRLREDPPAQKVTNAPTLQRFQSSSPQPSTNTPNQILPEPKDTNTSRVSFPSIPERAPQESLKTARVDYTDYYPIPKETKSPKQNIQSNVSFSSPHTFPVEKQPLTQEVKNPLRGVPPREPQAISPQKSQTTSSSQPAQKIQSNLQQPTPAQTTQPQKPKKRMIIG